MSGRNCVAGEPLRDRKVMPLDASSHPGGTYAPGTLPLLVPIVVEERNGWRRFNEPVSVGIPFPKGAVFDPERLSLADQNDQLFPLQAEALAHWSDGSIKWVLLDFLANVEPLRTSTYKLLCDQMTGTRTSYNNLVVEHTSGVIEVCTGRCKFVLNVQTFKPFERVVVAGQDVITPGGSSFKLVDDAGRTYQANISNIQVKTRGPVRTTIHVEGRFDSEDKPAYATFFARLSFFANSNLVGVTFTVRNPRAAEHSGGLWDLGDQGSIYFQHLSMEVESALASTRMVEWTTQPGESATSHPRASFEVVQKSSGGIHWDSANHVNRFGKVTTEFKGYRVMVDGAEVMRGDRANPAVVLSDGMRSVAIAHESFWQNFPKAFAVRENRLCLDWFPRLANDMHELQGGEQKTHSAFVKFEVGQGKVSDVAWANNRLVPRTTPEWYACSGAIPYVLPSKTQVDAASALSKAEQLVLSAVEGSHTFFHRREAIDEYGWRNFGDLYADHEAVRYEGATPLVAHYNNQYDVIYGAIVQYLRTGDARWFALMSDLAKHVIDIDIYHTQNDRPAFNGGMFWHTEHYSDAATCTHRTFSKSNVGTRDIWSCGGGPSNEHNYTTGLLYYFLLTGDFAAKGAVQGLADWVINMDAGSRNFMSFVDRRSTGLASSTVNRDYHGPGRGAGNSINALLDAYSVTRDERYLAKAEQLIQRCIHPQDSIEARHLEDVEYRWSYTVFLQVLGKYLDFKAERRETDYMFSYAQESLLHYARWMLDHEVPYKQVMHQVEIPTETWPAQDIRKSNVFKYAAKYTCEPLRSVFRKQSELFFDSCITDLLSFSTHALTRPIVLLMTNLSMHAYFAEHQNEKGLQSDTKYDFGKPATFTPQFYELYRMREKVHAAMDVWRALRCRVAQCLSICGVNTGGIRG
jgi:hypothetical protein